MTVPELGFGSAPVLGGIGKKQSLTAIAHAYQHGVRHFDCARSYGWGEAEGLLGRALGAYPRSSYRLISKCGIVPPRRRAALSLAKSAARKLVQVLPGARAFVRGVATKHFQPSGTYDVAALSGSLETSLRELSTSYLDVMLLHNFEVGKPGLPEVIAFLREQKRAGRIRRYGFCVEAELTPGVAYLAQLGVLDDALVQVPVSDALFRLPQEFRRVPLIAHSPFRYLSAPAPSVQTLSELFVTLAGACNCEALVCSMFNVAHIERNVQAQAAARG